MKHSHKVHIFGESFQIRSDQPPEVIEKISGYLDFKIREIGNKSVQSDKFRLAVLAAMNVAGELFDAREKLAESDKKSSVLEEKAKTLNSSLDKILEPTNP